MIWTFNIKLLEGRFAEVPWNGTIALDAASTLDDLHMAIQRAVGFGNDQLYDFYIAHTPRSRERIHFNDEEAGGGERQNPHHRIAVPAAEGPAPLLLVRLR